MALWRSWLACFPVTEEVAGSNPVQSALNHQIFGNLFFVAWFVYILYSKSYDIYYKGESQFPQKRLQEHNNNLSRYTAEKGPWQLVYLEKLASRTEALKKEKMLKRQNRKYIQWLLLQASNQLLLQI